jgi:hypothetical protein
MGFGLAALTSENYQIFLSFEKYVLTAKVRSQEALY